MNYTIGSHRQRFSLLRVLLSRAWRYAVWYKFADVAEEHTASIFRDEK
jgi:hypothetical protein